MGIKFGREYRDIVTDLTQAIKQVRGFYDFFEMSETDWSALEEEEREECLKTLADDIFYGLGTDPVLALGAGTVRHDADNHIIKVDDGDNLVSVIYLV